MIYPRHYLAGGSMLNELFIHLSGLGYIGLFLINLIGSSTIIFPLPAAAFVLASGAFLNPVVLGLTAGLGAALGELVGYGLGLGGRKLSDRKFGKELLRAEKMFARYGGFVTLVVFAATPLPDDVVGVAAGVLNYQVKKFFIAVFIGKVILNTILASAGFYGINGIISHFM